MTSKEIKTRLKPKNYAHFDSRVSKDNAIAYIMDRQKVKSHPFYPFIHFKIEFKKYNKNNGVKYKKRDIYYAAHMDGYIYKYYAILLNELYKDKIKQLGINNVPIGYRDDLKKCNIDFAKQAFDFIISSKSCDIIIGDFTSFFDQLNHSYLKKMICNVLGEDTLPPDYYNIFKNITKFSWLELEDIAILNGLTLSKENHKKLNRRNRILSLYQFKKAKKSYLKTNANKYGIPQGSPISAILSNIYMLEFDKKINDYVNDNNGMYMRYSDDFIIIIPKNVKNSLEQHTKVLLNEVDKIDDLELEQKKTKQFYYKDNKIYNLDNESTSLDYLGFTFYGDCIKIRDKTISKYHYRMYKKAKTITKCERETRNGNLIPYKNIYRLYSERGAFTGRGNFITYVNRTKRIMHDNSLDTSSTDNNMQKLKKRLKRI